LNLSLPQIQELLDAFSKRKEEEKRAFEREQFKLRTFSRKSIFSKMKG